MGVIKRTFWDLELVGEASDVEKEQRGTDVGSDSDAESLVDLASEPSDLDEKEWGASADCMSPRAVCLVEPGTMVPSDGQWLCQSNSQLPPEEASSTGTSPSGAPGSSNAEDVQTTILITNVPKRCSTADLCQVLNREGLQGCYDFACVPSSRRRLQSFGWAVVNMVSREAAERAMQWLDGCKPLGAQVGLKVSWHEQDQGFEANVERYRRTDFHQAAPVWRPMIFDRCGGRLPFPRAVEEVPTSDRRRGRHASMLR